jgi:hypothetical protein
VRRLPAPDWHIEGRVEHAFHAAIMLFVVAVVFVAFLAQRL